VQNGHLPIFEGDELHKWLNLQKRALKENLLTKTNAKKLEALGIHWSLESNWQENFQKLRKFKYSIE
jgi:hypothetical protein